MPLPNMNELQTMFGAWNPQAYLTGQENLGLERQLVNEDLSKKRQDTRKVELENLFSEQDNPNRIQTRVLENEGRVLDNTGKGYSNRQAKLETERKEANHWNMLQEDQRKALLSATDDDIKLADARAEQMIRHPDPKIQAQGLALSQLTKSAREAKLAHERGMDKVKYEQGEETKRSAARNTTSVQVANIGATSRQNIASMKGAPKVSLSIQEQLKSGKLDYVKAATLLRGAAMAEEDGSPEQQKLLAEAAAYEQAELNRQNARAAGKPDVGAIAGIPTQQVNPALGGNAAPSREVSGKVAPPVGTVVRGYVYMGGDPSKPTSWKKQ